MTRLAVYAHFGESPKVARYVSYFLKELRSLGFEICFVSNSPVPIESQSRFPRYPKVYPAGKYRLRFFHVAGRLGGIRFIQSGRTVANQLQHYRASATPGAALAEFIGEAMRFLGANRQR